MAQNVLQLIFVLLHVWFAASADEHQQHNMKEIFPTGGSLGSIGHRNTCSSNQFSPLGVIVLQHDQHFSESKWFCIVLVPSQFVVDSISTISCVL